MTRLSLVFAAIVLSCGPAGSVFAQMAPMPSQASSGRVLGSVTNGNTTVVFEPANNTDIETQPLMTWGEFAADHPAIAHALEYNPSLISDPGYLKKHPDFSAFLQAHPEVREAMAADPGNFNAIWPRPGE
jgi:hypothetical protein